MNTLIATSRRGEMRALAVQGIFATDCHAQLRGLILRHLSPAHAALLAEPQHDAEKRNIDWYADCPGTPVRCADLPESEAQALRARAAELARDISDAARRLRETSGHEHGLSGALLALAPLHAADDDLWSVGGQPVLINWGFAPGGPGAEAQDLTRLGTTPVAAPAAVAAAAPVVASAGMGRGCLWWLLPLLLLLLLLWLLLAALGLLPSPLPGGCVPAPDTAALDKEKARTAPLETELEELLRRLRERAALCRPPASPPAVTPDEPRPEPEVIEPFLGETPKEEPRPEPQPKQEPKPEPKPEPGPEPKPEPKPEPRPKPRKGEDMTIPDDAAKKQDLSFLEGCWVSETGLYSHPSNLPLVAEYCFDKNGRGRRFAREKGGRVCSGPAQARFRNGKLYFEADYAACPRGSRFVPQQVECTGSDTRTHCRGKELKEGRGTTWDARFKRK